MSKGNNNHFEKFTKEAKLALVVAQEKAKEANISYIGTEHILIGILSQENSLGCNILKSFGVSLENVYLVLQTVGRVHTMKKGAASKKTTDLADGAFAGLSGFAKKVIEDAVKYAYEYGHSFVGTEHLLYALVSQDNTAATVILENMKIDTADVRTHLTHAFKRAKDASNNKGQGGNMANANVNPIEFFLNGLQGVLQGGNVPPNEQFKQQNPASKKQADQGGSKTPALDYFTTDLIDECKNKEIMPIIGRAKEIERLVAILNRKTKNNPVLIGEPGVGKTAIVEGLAQRIISEEVPASMLDKKILILSMTSVVAGTKYRGEFEERIKQIIDEASTLDNVILFIDELHTVIGAGSAEGSLDAANILKPALSRSKIQVIGATTLDEYRKHIEDDSALERRFQPIMVEEPSEPETLEILKGIKDDFEDHHSMIFSDDAMEAAVKLSVRYVNDRFLPDKAIDLLDEAAATIRVKKKSDTSEIKKLQKALAKVIKKKEEAVSRQDYEHAAELRSKELEVLKKMEEARKEKKPKKEWESIDANDVAHVIEVMTGIPAKKLLKADKDKLSNLEETLKSKIVGQEEAIHEVSKAIRRSRAGFSDKNRPVGSFIFMGPTGVGKTELVKTLAEEVYGSRDAMIKIDMSEFMERHNTSRLVGTTAGYVGYEDGGQLTEAVRRKPHSIVLFDEIEKAHPDVFNMLLQILEDGVLTDSKGRKVNFKNTIIIMTSNIGAERFNAKAGPIGFALKNDVIQEKEQEFNETKMDILEDLKEHFRPEFLNRIDSVAVFQPLKHKSILEIVKLHTKLLEERLSENEISIKLSKSALEFIADKGYDPEYGARPVRRAVQKYIETPLSEMFIDGKIKPGSTVKASRVKDELRFTVAKKSAKK